jgi:hypothetical protein
VPESERDAFITDILDRFQPIAAKNPSEANTFKFYQKEVMIEVGAQLNSGRCACSRR